ncbi:ABC transporter permease [Streptomyces phaeochromogenes]|uniref:ABC transporter permease n=1 Tax=Streptomyces phaeochromogenes TaxID=1923 RepID=UPI0034062A11
MGETDDAADDLGAGEARRVAPDPGQEAVEIRVVEEGVDAGRPEAAELTLRGDAVVLGVAMNLLAVGLTSFPLRTIFGVQGTFDDPSLTGLPLVGGFSPLAYLAWAAVAVAALMLSRHVWGLRLRGVGEAPESAATRGVSPARYKYAVVLVSGVLCGLAGAQLALGNVTLFSENMTAGRGWIAVVAVMLGRALLFGVAEAAGFRLQGLGLPQQATDAAPYVVTFGALFLSTVQRRRRNARTTGVVS